MSERNLQVLTSPCFVAALSVLLLNDFLLKPHFPNALTGKLSDFAGLFVFALFWSALFPRFRRKIYFATAALFALWKSAYSQPFIEAWNGLQLIPLGRTVDATDLVALAALPASYLYGLRASRTVIPPRRLATGLLAGLSVFAFAATSYSTRFDYARKYYFPDSETTLMRKAHHLRHLNPEYGFWCTPGESKVTIQIPSDVCFKDVSATASLGEEQGRSVIILQEMGHRCPEGKGDKQKMLDLFERDFIGKLGSLNLPTADGTGAPREGPTPKGEGTLYMVAIGDPPGVSVEKLAEHFERKYGLQIKVLRKLSLGDEGRDPPSLPGSRPAAERLLDYVRREYPKEAAEPGAALIALTADMYVEGEPNYRPFYHREEGSVIISLGGLDSTAFCEPSDPPLVALRLRKAVARAIGTIYYRLPRSDDPRSVLHTDIGCIDELDAAGEDF